jgi:hypothetical protein
MLLRRCNWPPFLRDFPHLCAERGEWFTTRESRSTPAGEMTERGTRRTWEPTSIAPGRARRTARRTHD